MNLEKRSFLKKNAVSGNGQFLAYSINTLAKTGCSLKIHTQINLMFSHDLSGHAAPGLYKFGGLKSPYGKFVNELISILLFGAAGFLKLHKNKPKQFTGIGWTDKVVCHLADPNSRRSYR